MKRVLAIAILSACVVFASGCIMVSGKTTSEPTKSYLPKDAQKIGGGFEISYIMPEDGTVVLIDRATGKTIQTISLREGETFDFACRGADQEMFRNIGVEIQRADFVLYTYPKRTRQTLQTQTVAQPALLLPPPPLTASR